MPKGGPGQPKSKKHREAIAAALRGKRKSEAHKKALSKPKTIEHRKKLSLVNKRIDVQNRRKETMLRVYGVTHPKKIAKLNNLRIEYWLEKGFSDKDARKQITTFQQAASRKRKTNTSIWRTDYWMKKGLSKTEAIVRVSELQTKNASKTAVVISKESQNFLNEIERKSGVRVEREVRLLGKFLVDGYIPSRKIVIEYLGSFWHMHPSLFAPTDINRITGWEAQSKWNEDKGRVKCLEKAGYTVVTVWDIEVSEKVKADIVRSLVYAG